MWFVLLAILVQLYWERPLLEAEDARLEPPAALIAGLESPDPRIQRLAVRGMGRLERPEYADAVRPLLASPDSGVRLEAVNALGQMNGSFDFTKAITDEKDGAVRSVIYETAGRLRETPAGAEMILVAGLHDPQPARTGAAKGLEALFRTHRNVKPAAETLAALRQAVRENTDPTLRELAMLTLNASGDADPEILKLVLEDAEPQVRRLGVIAAKQWKDDASYIVRYEALKVAPSCERAALLIRDPSDHVSLLAIDLLGSGGCSARLVERIVDTEKDWRKQAHAIVALARVDPESARKRLPRMADHEVWQAKTYAAEAARIIKDDKTLSRLGRDNHPSVMAAAIVTPRDAVRVLDSSHYGLIVEAAKKLKGWNEGRLALPTLRSALERITREKKANSRDARVEILQRLREFGDLRLVGDLRPYAADFDPVIAKLAVEIMSERGGAATEPITRRYATRPVPPDAYLRSLAGATASVRMREAGAFTIQLIPEEAPVTVATFVQLAEARYYNGLTLHRVVPNFVLQGGSPGASEYVGQSDFMRDELGLLSHRRGTLGISTRGRDTGDAQIFINLIDNFRLDHAYTVFALVVEGMENVDKIQEGDTIDSIEIRKSVKP